MDNHITMHMEKNGRNLCNVNSRHIHIQVFLSRLCLIEMRYISNIVRQKCKLAYFFTKQLQGDIIVLDKKYYWVLMLYR